MDALISAELDQRIIAPEGVHLRTTAAGKPAHRMPKKYLLSLMQQIRCFCGETISVVACQHPWFVQVAKIVQQLLGE